MEDERKYIITRHADGGITLTLGKVIDGSFLYLSKPELRVIIQDLIQCLTGRPTVAGTKNKS